MPSRVFTVVGARPQFIKAAVVSHAIDRQEKLIEAIVHTGQHYDYNMSQAFFDELSIPKPTMNLGISGGSHAEMTGRMMLALEEAMLANRPDIVLLYGDTNSTLAAALVAAKLKIPIAHVEAGARTHSAGNPEEINRVCADHVSTLLLACTRENLENLSREGLAPRSDFVGDPMYDAFLEYSESARRPVLSMLDGSPNQACPRSFYYLTCHREENAADPSTLTSILDTMDLLDCPVVYPVHPRNRKVVLAAAENGHGRNVLLVEPLSYLESIYLVRNAEQVITDSGGLQREAFFAGVKCTTLLDFEVWPETMVDGRNLLAKPISKNIIEAMNTPQLVNEDYQPFGDGTAAVRIATALTKCLGA